MRNLLILTTFAFALLAGCATGDKAAAKKSVFPANVVKPRIMIVGDSISAGPGCYKKYLVQNLHDNGISNFEFVGQYTDDCGGGVRHSAVSCSATANYLAADFTLPKCFKEKVFPGMATLVKTHKPDLIMMQLGVNDVWGGTPLPQILTNYEQLIAIARAENPHVVIVLAQIQKIIPDNCKSQNLYQEAEALVNAVPAWAKKVSTKQSPVLVADLWTNSDPQQAPDCVHPGEEGAKRMGFNWYNALKDILK